MPELIIYGIKLLEWRRLPGIDCVGSTVPATPEGPVAAEDQHFLWVDETLVVLLCVASTAVDVSHHVEILGQIL